MLFPREMSETLPSLTAKQDGILLRPPLMVGQELHILELFCPLFAENCTQYNFSTHQALANSTTASKYLIKSLDFVKVRIN